MSRANPLAYVVDAARDLFAGDLTTRAVGIGFAVTLACACTCSDSCDVEGPRCVPGRHRHRVGFQRDLDLRQARRALQAPGGRGRRGSSQ